MDEKVSLRLSEFAIDFTFLRDQVGLAQFFSSQDLSKTYLARAPTSA